MSGAHWQAVCRSQDVGAKPLRLMLDGAPFVLFREGAGRVVALQDRCPHRLVALSGGRVRCGEIECPYHGWRFDGQGRCTAVPGLLGEVPAYRVPGLRVAERAGGVFVSTGTPEGAPYVHCQEGAPVIARVVRSQTASTLLDVAENILDATHTHYTHRGLLRGLGAARQEVEVAITGGPGWVEASYTGEDKQQGLISKLLEGARVKTVGRFRYPGIAELEYWGPRGMVLSTTFHLRQADTDSVEGVGWLVGPRGGVADHLKALLFEPMFRIALEQDRRVLRSAKANAALAPDARPVIGPLDFLRADIAAIMAEKMPAAAAAPIVVRMEL